MAQKPIAMEQLKQILQLQKDGVPIREMARRAGISRNSVRKYLSLLQTTSDQPELPDNKALAGKAYSNDCSTHDAHRLPLSFGARCQPKPRLFSKFVNGFMQLKPKTIV